MAESDHFPVGELLKGDLHFLVLPETAGVYVVFHATHDKPDSYEFYEFSISDIAPASNAAMDVYKTLVDVFPCSPIDPPSWWPWYGIIFPVNAETHFFLNAKIFCFPCSLSVVFSNKSTLSSASIAFMVSLTSHTVSARSSQVIHTASFTAAGKTQIGLVPSSSSTASCQQCWALKSQ